jgi:hypothetical protein
MQLSELAQARTRMSQAHDELENAQLDLEKAQEVLREIRVEVSDAEQQEIERLKSGVQLAQAKFDTAQESELSARLALEKAWDEAPTATKSPRWLGDDDGWLQSTQVPRLLYHPSPLRLQFIYLGTDRERRVQWTRVKALVPDLELQWNAAAAETKSTMDGVWYESTAVPGLRYCPAEYRFVADRCQWTSILQRVLRSS